MKKFKLLAATAVMVGALGGSAQAVTLVDVLSAEVSYGSSPTLVYTDGGTGLISQGPLTIGGSGGYSHVSFNVQSQVYTGDPTPSIYLSSISVKAAAGAGPLTFTATESNLYGSYKQVSVGPFGSPSGFTTGNLPSGWSLTEKVYYSASNQTFAGTLLGTYTPGGNSTPTYTLPTPTSATSPWSLTEVITIQGPAHTSAHMTATGQSVYVGAVPEPSTWALMLVGFAGVAYLGMRRHNQQALSA